jgi:hypothetical protein
VTQRIIIQGLKYFQGRERLFIVPMYKTLESREVSLRIKNSEKDRSDVAQVSSELDS